MLEKDYALDASKRWEEAVKELRRQWRSMWNERFDDKVNAEGIAKQDYPLLYLEGGTVVVATRRYRAPDFFEILERHRYMSGIYRTDGYAEPSVGGWRSFCRKTLRKQVHFDGRSRLESQEGNRKATVQKKKGGRGWIHKF
jgi:hypothetical protein